ncbi:MAG: hypothetical protein ACKPKO_21505, partial [Candidatus Fonsibacter sp.]
SAYLLEEVLKIKPREAQEEYKEESLYKHMSNFYVVANGYKEETNVGDHSDLSPLRCAPPTSSGRSLQLGGRRGLVDFTHKERRQAQCANHHIH